MPAAIRYALGDDHTYEFIEGSVPTSIAPGRPFAPPQSKFLSPAHPSPAPDPLFTSTPPKEVNNQEAYTSSQIPKSLPGETNSLTGIESLVSPGDDVFRYVDEKSPASFVKAMADLNLYITEAGPFDGVMAFSEGGALAASLIIQKMQEDRRQQQLYPLFKCAIFFSGGVPMDPSAGAGLRDRRLMGFEQDGEVIEIPTAHIWGENDKLYPTFGPVLSGLCKRDRRAVFIHTNGHEIPGPRSADAVAKAAEVINRTIARGMMLR